MTLVFLARAFGVHPNELEYVKVKCSLPSPPPGACIHSHGQVIPAPGWLRSKHGSQPSISALAPEMQSYRTQLLQIVCPQSPRLWQVRTKMQIPCLV